MGQMEGCWCWGVTLGDRETAKTDSFSLSELNASRARGSNHSVNSLPGPPATCGSTQGSVVSWAESFETLLQDRVAVTYFTVSVTAQSCPCSHPLLDTKCPTATVPPDQQISLPCRSSSRRSSVLKTSTFGRHVSASSRSQPVTHSRYQFCAAQLTQMLGGMWAELSSLHVQGSCQTPFLRG